MSLGLPASLIDFYRVAHRLKGMKGETYGKDDREAFERIVPVNEPCQDGQIIAGKIVVLEERQNAYVRADADEQIELSSYALSVVDNDARKIVYDNREG